MMLRRIAIAGIPPLSGFFSKDEILSRAFIGNRFSGVCATATAWLTAFYMFRLMSLTFYGSYRGPRSRLASPAAVAEARFTASSSGRCTCARGGRPRESRGDHGVRRTVEMTMGRSPFGGSPAITGPLMALPSASLSPASSACPRVLADQRDRTLPCAEFCVEALACKPVTRTRGQSGARAVRVPLGLMCSRVVGCGILPRRHFYLRNPGLPRRLPRGGAARTPCC
jgi:NADH:ubiquinone oxidoreductase subunit 5 (subunit L)/multisubunit Na+/H+ antiporter MnhA subunit